MIALNKNYFDFKNPLSKQIVVVFFTAVLLQWVYFYGYYNQPIFRSVIWSLIDWACWFFVAIGFVTSIKKHNLKNHPVLFGLIFIFVSGPLQISMSSALYGSFYGFERSLLESFLHLTDKRWFQNIFISGALYTFILYIFSLLKINNERAIKEVILNDGKKIYYLSPSEIICFSSSRNYVVVEINDREIIVRSTLNEISKQFSIETFIQVNRSCYVNIHHIKCIEKYSRTSHQLILSNNSVANIGRTYQKDILNNHQLSHRG